jgi:hypothetical protein
MRALSPFLLCVALIGCAPDLRMDHPFDGQPPSGNFIVIEDEGSGSQKLTVDATNKESWAYLDLDSMREINAESGIDPAAWDLRFQRYVVAGNGGSSGPGTVEIAILNTDYDALTQAPATGYQKDGAQTVIGGGPEGGWYFYDLNVHKLTARAGQVYVIRSGDGAYFKLKMLSYYDQNGTAARLTMRVGKLAAP